jgi:hypothetical protein
MALAAEKYSRSTMVHSSGKRITTPSVQVKMAATMTGREREGGVG